MIASARPADGGFIVVLIDGQILQIPNDLENRYRRKLQSWLDEGNTLGPEDPEPSPPTTEDIYNQTIQNIRLLKGYILAVNDGSIVPGTNMTGAQLKAAVKAKM